MKIVVAVDSFKGSLSSEEIANTFCEQLKEFDVKKVIVADGGEGTLDAIILSSNGRYVNMKSKGPKMEDIDARYGILQDDKTVVIELATCAGLTLVKGEKNPLITTTYGVGEQIKHAIRNGYRQFIIGLGGSATNDCGIGMLQSLGYRFYDKNGNVLTPGGGGKQLIDICQIDDHQAISQLKKCKFTIASDVKNVLYGKNGAAYVFARQKGASDEDIEFLDKGLRNFTNVVKKYNGTNMNKVKGAGAAGGIGGAFVAFLNSKVESGIELVLKKTNFYKYLEDADYVITGEGKFDSQTFFGKAPIVIAKKAMEKGVSPIIVCGINQVDKAMAQKEGIKAIYEIANPKLSLEDNLKYAKENLIATIKKIKEEISK